MKPLALITGAAGGLGRALITAFSTDWRVAALTHRSALSEAVTWQDGADVTNGEEIARVLAVLQEQHGPVDVLINNAGAAEDELIPRMPESAWDRVVDSSLKGAFLCARAVLPGMLAARRGHLIHISSLAGVCGATGQANYAAAKAGMIGLMLSLAKEGGPSNVCSNAVLPGVMETPMLSSIAAPRREALRRANLLDRFNGPAEVAHFIAFLARLRHVSGQVFQLDSRISPWT